jgi:hypothetical protein
MNDQDHTGDLTDVLVAAGVGVLLYAGLLWFARTYRDGQDLQILVLSGITFSAFGWIVGILASPYSKKERSTFSELAKLIYGFASGYLLSKFDRVVNQLTEPQYNLDQRLVAIALFAVASFLIAVGITYVSRSYWITKATS